MGYRGVNEDAGDGLTIPDLYHEVFPEYLAMGMTYDQFWRQDCSLVIAYRQAYKIRQDEINRAAWLQGLYVFKALQANPLVVYGFAKKDAKPEPYPNKPIDFTVNKKTPQQRLDDDAKARSDRIIKNMMEFMALQKQEDEMNRLIGNDKEKGVTNDGRRNLDSD